MRRNGEETGGGMTGRGGGSDSVLPGQFGNHPEIYFFLKTFVLTQLACKMDGVNTFVHTV